MILSYASAKRTLAHVVSCIGVTVIVASNGTSTAVGQDGGMAGYVPPSVREHAFELSIRNIMRRGEIVGQSPTDIAWTDDSNWVYFWWLPAGKDWDAEAQLWRVPASGGEPELIAHPREADSLALTFSGGDISPDGLWRVTVHNGDLYLVDRRDLSVRRLTDTRDQIRAPRFAADGSSIFYTQQRQVYSSELETGAVRQLTDIRSGRARREREPDDQRAFLAEQQAELFEYVRRRQAREEVEQARSQAALTESVQTVHTGRMGTPRRVEIDRNGRYVAVTATRSADGQRQVLVPRWITEDGYTEVDETRAKVGDVQSSSHIGIHWVGSDSITWLDVDAAVRSHAMSHDPVGVFLPEQVEAVRSGEIEINDPVFAGWNEAGTYGLITARAANNQHRWTLSVEAGSGELIVLEHLADSAWVRGPCDPCTDWIGSTDQVYIVSEASRFSHLYTVNADGSGRQQLTDGSWEVHDVQIPENGEYFILRTNEQSPFEQHVYRMDFDGSGRTRIIEGVGYFEGTVSPDGRRLAVLHSTQNRPPELFVSENRPGAPLAQVTSSPSIEWLSFPWLRAEIIRFPARDGAQVPARIYRPADLGVTPNGAAVVFAHGAGYRQNVHEWWSGYYREYMFHHFLAAQGVTVLDVDFRHSAGYGRDWRTAVYRHVGGKDVADCVDGVRWLADHEGVDPARVGIYGGSYGGFLTLMAMFTEPDVFRAGAALRAVTDWAHYNNRHTSNTLNTPQDDPEAFERSSPIYHAEGLQGRLLMAHPMYDTNVHFSDIVRLTQRLIELGKEDWELAVYPTENHRMLDPASWVDQYRRIFELFWRTLSAPECDGDCPLPVPAAG